MPSRLRPTNSFATDAILVGDPGRALLLAQELIEQPKMSNHARGLWGYSGTTPAGAPLSIQSTGMGGPSAALVLADLAELGVRRLIRVGSCAAGPSGPEPGAVIAVECAIATDGSASSFGLEPGARVTPERELGAALRAALGEEGRAAAVASFDVPPHGEDLPEGAVVADMQTVAVLHRSAGLGIAAAAVLIVVEEVGKDPIEDELRDSAAGTAGRAAATALSP